MSQRFISESDIAAKKKELNDAWNATRGEDDPENPPDEPAPDHRTLFHRLEEQKLKKQEDYEDAHRLKNMVRGLEDEEVQFLDMVDRTKMEQQRRLKNEETNALTEFRKRKMEMEIARTSELVSTVSHAPSAAHTNRTPKNSQKLLLSGAVKRKADASEHHNDNNNKSSPTTNSTRNDSQQSTNVEETQQQQKSALSKSSVDVKAKQCTANEAQTAGVDGGSSLIAGHSAEVNDNGSSNNNSGAIGSHSSAGGGGDSSSSSGGTVGGSNDTSGVGGSVIPSTIGSNGYLKCVAVLPGIGPYSDSSDSGDTTNDSDPDTRPRIVIRNKKRSHCC
uniref:Protein FAM192A-like n=1 Tax=Hirondellea gigas TaxID=1518452 RepID=A0A6A7FZ53_9CRUS